MYSNIVPNFRHVPLTDLLYQKVSANESKDTSNEELWSKIRDFKRSVTNNLNNSDKKYKKIKFNSHDDLPINKTIKLYNIITSKYSIPV